MTKAQKEEKSTDDMQNGGKKELEDRVTDLEARVDLLVRCNCLLEMERAN